MHRSEIQHKTRHETDTIIEKKKSQIVTSDLEGVVGLSSPPETSHRSESLGLTILKYNIEFVAQIYIYICT